MGENLLARTAAGHPLMKYRENTIRSFNTAAAAGASFVEFDVQVLSQNLTCPEYILQWKNVATF